MSVRDWRALARTRNDAPCVDELSEQRTLKFLSEAQHVLENAAAIRQCAASLGFPLDG